MLLPSVAADIDYLLAIEFNWSLAVSAQMTAMTLISLASCLGASSHFVGLAHPQLERSPIPAAGFRAQMH